MAWATERFTGKLVPDGTLAGDQAAAAIGLVEVWPYGIPSFKSCIMYANAGMARFGSLDHGEQGTDTIG
jgi:hypothetical protein